AEGYGVVRMDFRRNRARRRGASTRSNLLRVRRRQDQKCRRERERQSKGFVTHMDLVKTLELVGTAQFLLNTGDEIDARRVEPLQANGVADIQPELVSGVVEGPISQARAVRVACLGEVSPVSSERFCHSPV